MAAPTPPAEAQGAGGGDDSRYLHLATLERLALALPEIGLNSWVHGVDAVKWAIAALSAQPRQDGKQAAAWAEGYKAGVSDEQTSAANIGIAGLGGKVGPARENPYRKSQPASAPVGVEGFDKWFDEYTNNNYTDEMLAEAAWKAALAQQPAAVDEAMVERACAAALKEGGKGTHNSHRIMRAALTAALAQPQGEG